MPENHIGRREAIIRLNQIRDRDDLSWDSYDRICFDIAIAELEDVVVATMGRVDAALLKEQLKILKTGIRSHGSSMEFNEGFWSGVRESIKIVDKLSTQ